MQGRALPDEIYLDTSIFIGAMIAGAPHAQACQDFCNRLIGADTYVYFSELVRLELPQALRKLATRRANLPLAMRTQYRLDDWGTDASVRDQWQQVGLRAYEQVIAQFRDTFELPWTYTTWQESLAVIAQTGLQTIDATHVATVQKAGIQDFAAVDVDFRKATGITLWLVRDPGR